MFAVVICVILSMFTELACLEFHCENVMDCVSLVHCLFTIHVVWPLISRIISPPFSCVNFVAYLSA